MVVKLKVEGSVLPKISVIIPAYNEQHFLPGLLDSLRDHLKIDVEIIVVDCGSQDNTVAVAKRYTCKLIKNNKKEFPSTARNIGVEASNGQILVFLDADVEVTEYWGARLTALARSGVVEDGLFVTGDQYHISKDPAWIERFWFRPLRKVAKDYINGGNLITTRLLFDRVGGFDTQLETGEDVDFCHRAVAMNSILIIDPEWVVLHEGFPKSVMSFIRRERWHGRGDFQQFQSIWSSKVALLTLLFMFAHFLLVVAFFAPDTYALSLSLLALVMVLLVSFVSAVYRFRRSGIKIVFVGVVISYMYFLGRSLSVVDLCKEKTSAFRC